MEKLTDYLSNVDCIYVEYITELSEGLEPVCYRRISGTEIEIVGGEENVVVKSRATEMSLCGALLMRYVTER